MRNYVLWSVALSGILLLADYWFGESLGLHPLFTLLVLFFLGQSLPIGWLTSIALRNPSQSSIIFIGAIGFRMITGLGLLLVFYFFNIPDLTYLSIQFVGVYLFYLVFELTVVLTNLRRNSK